MSSFWLVLFSSRLLYNGTYCVRLDESLHICPNRVSELLTLRDMVTFALSEQESAYPAHTSEPDEDDDDKPLVCPDRIILNLGISASETPSEEGYGHAWELGRWVFWPLA